MDAEGGNKRRNVLDVPHATWWRKKIEGTTKEERREIQENYSEIAEMRRRSAEVRQETQEAWEMIKAKERELEKWERKGVGLEEGDRMWVSGSTWISYAPLVKYDDEL
jgi:hypothetical protein